ncbi:MAG: bile acid:sodium symporter, partial [Parvularculaceae bacterium]
MTPSELDQLSISLDPAAQGMLAASIIIMIFAVSLGLRREHFVFLRTDPKLFWGGVAAQIIGLPLMTFLLVIVMAPPPSVALGMIVVAACPGGNVSNFMTWGARGDVAYSVSLTAASSIIAAFWTPA